MKRRAWEAQLQFELPNDGINMKSGLVGGEAKNHESQNHNLLALKAKRERR